MTRVSVILATSNRKDDLIECVESILAQTYRDFELIIMDDGSTDGTAAAFHSRWSEFVVDSPDATTDRSVTRRHDDLFFAIDGIPTVYVRQGNRGCSRAFNCGLKRAKGEFVTFVDPAVRWDRRRLEKQVRVFRDGHRQGLNIVICLSGMAPVRNGRRLKSVDPGEGGWLFTDVLNDRHLPYETALIDRRVFERIGGFDENLPNCEDYDLWVRLTANFPIHTVTESLVSGPPRKGNGKNAWAANRFRVYALEKAFQSGYLVPEYRCMVAEQIVSKCEKLVTGFEKRSNAERASFYDRKRRKFAGEVRKLRASGALS